MGPHTQKEDSPTDDRAVELCQTEGRPQVRSRPQGPTPAEMERESEKKTRIEICTPVRSSRVRVYLESRRGVPSSERLFPSSGEEYNEREREGEKAARETSGRRQLSTGEEEQKKISTGRAKRDSARERTGSPHHRLVRLVVGILTENDDLDLIQTAPEPTHRKQKEMQRRKEESKRRRKGPVIRGRDTSLWLSIDIYVSRTFPSPAFSSFSLPLEETCPPKKTPNRRFSNKQAWSHSPKLVTLPPLMKTARLTTR